MKITIDDAGKRFNFEWILQHIRLTLHPHTSYAILGPNGSGKSTLLQMISGVLTPSAGHIHYHQNQQALDIDSVYRQISFAAPYIELIEEYTAAEMVAFQSSFKKRLHGISSNEVLHIAQLEKHADKQIRYFSSGMKQRLKLTMALLADVSCVLLDEPTTNLDAAGSAWYLQLMQDYSHDRLVVISSNLEREYGFCHERIDVTQFKKR